jgi:DNA invertase Pin-like site-specific DNA recombinase
MRVSKADGSQVLDLQKDALTSAGVPERNIYSDTASGKKDDRPGLDACLKAVRTGDTLVIWKLDRLGRNLRHLVNVVHDLNARGIGLRVLTGQGAAIDTTTAAGKLVFGIFAALAEFERELIRERTIAGLAAARARGRNGGRKPKMTPAKLRLAQAAMGKRGTIVADLCKELGDAVPACVPYRSAAGAWKETHFPNESIAVKRSYSLDGCTPDAGIIHLQSRFRRLVSSTLIPNGFLIGQQRDWAEAPAAILIDLGQDLTDTTPPAGGNGNPARKTGRRPTIDTLTNLPETIKLVSEDIWAEAKAHSGQSSNRKFGITGGEHGFQSVWSEAVPEKRWCWFGSRRSWFGSRRRMVGARPVSRISS